MSFHKIGLIAALSLGMSACTPTPPLPAASSVPADAMAGYRLSGGDRFRLNVYNEPNLSGQEYSVGSDGEASLPLIGPLKVGGMTAREAEAAIAARYGAGFVNSPRVNVDITQFRPFYILGEVGKAGQYAFAPGMTVLNAVALAGGFTYRANTTRIYIRRDGGGAEEVVPLAANTPVLPGDTIRIVERFF